MSWNPLRSFPSGELVVRGLMFGSLFRKKPAAQVELQPDGDVFPWPAGSTLKPLDRLTLALPAAMLDPDEPMALVITCDDDAEVAAPEGDDKIYVRLQPGMAITLTKNVQAIVLPWSEGETDPKRIEIVSTPAGP